LVIANLLFSASGKATLSHIGHISPAHVGGLSFDDLLFNARRGLSHPVGRTKVRLHAAGDRGGVSYRVSYLAKPCGAR
jgi:hypothetical protein